jgi:hypothetical protein
VRLEPGTAEAATQRGRRVVDALARAGRKLGFEVAHEYPVPGGRIDLVWLLPATIGIPGVDAPLPAVGFEIESSWRTRKHIKGDYLNLHDLGASLGVIVLLGDGRQGRGHAQVRPGHGRPPRPSRGRVVRR